MYLRKNNTWIILKLTCQLFPALLGMNLSPYFSLREGVNLKCARFDLDLSISWELIWDVLSIYSRNEIIKRRLKGDLLWGIDWGELTPGHSRLQRKMILKQNDNVKQFNISFNIEAMIILKLVPKWTGQHFDSAEFQPHLRAHPFHSWTNSTLSWSQCAEHSIIIWPGCKKSFFKIGIHFFDSPPFSCSLSQQICKRPASHTGPRQCLLDIAPASLLVFFFSSIFNHLVLMKHLRQQNAY